MTMGTMGSIWEEQARTSFLQSCEGTGSAGEVTETAGGAAGSGRPDNTS